MERRLIFWIAVLMISISAWLYLDITSERIDIQPPQLVDPKTGVKKELRDFFNLRRLLSKEDVRNLSAQEELYGRIFNWELFRTNHYFDSYTREEDLQLSAWPVANQSQCGEQLSWILDNLNANQNYTYVQGPLGLELTKYMDSFGRPESGTFSGLTTWAGSFAPCLSASLDSGRIKTRYCLARMRPSSWPSEDIVRPETGIRIGICLPETCDTSSFAHHHSAIEQLTKWELPDLYKRTLNFKQLYCVPDERSPIRQLPTSGRIYLFVVGSWMVFVIVGTIVHEVFYRKKKPGSLMILQNAVVEQTKVDKSSTAPLRCLENSPGGETSCFERLLEAVSLHNGFKSFAASTFVVRYNIGERVRLNLGGLDFVKALCIFIIVLYHGNLFGATYDRSTLFINYFFAPSTRVLYTHTVHLVDMFFFFFGVLFTYTMMRKFNRSQLSNPITWLGVNLVALLRIGPLYALAFWYGKSILPYTGSSPWWDYGINQESMIGVCKLEPWWKSIVYFGMAGHTPVPYCNPVAWYLVAYMNILIFLPLVTYILCSLPNLLSRAMLVSALMLASISIIGHKQYAQTAFDIEEAHLLGSVITVPLERFILTHVNILGRLGCVTFGCLFGYLLRQYEIGYIERWPAWLVSVPSVLIVALLNVVGIFIPALVMPTGPYTMHEIVIPTFMIMIIWPLLNGILMIQLATTYNHVAFVRFLNHQAWHSINRLSIGILLIQAYVILYAITSYQEGPGRGFLMSSMKVGFFAYFVSFMLAFVFYLFFEAPLTKLLMLMKPEEKSVDTEARSKIPQEDEVTKV